MKNYIKPYFLFFILLFFLFNYQILIFAQDEDSEDYDDESKEALEKEMFGDDDDESGEESEENDNELQSNGKTEYLEKKDEIGLSEEESFDDEDIDKIENDTLAIGGSIRTRHVYSIFDKDKSTIFSFNGIEYKSETDKEYQNPNEALIYFDANPNSELRGFLRGRLTYNPDLEDDKTKVNLEEFFIEFNLKRTIFIRTGKQKIKWGTGRIWNPTDSLNVIKKDPFNRQLDREGVSLTKFNMPLFGSIGNFYIFALHNDVKKYEDFGGGSRLEVSFSNDYFAGEVSSSFVARKKYKPIWNFDFSLGFLDFELYGEISWTYGSNYKYYKLNETALSSTDLFILDDEKNERIKNKVRTKWVAGLSYQLEYNENDNLYIYMEYFRNEEGLKKEDYVPHLFQMTHDRYYLGEHYGALLLSLPEPWSLEDISFSLYNVVNISDAFSKNENNEYDTFLNKDNISDVSFVNGFSIGISLIDDLSISTLFLYHHGNEGSEFALGGQKFSFETSLTFTF